jgi:hypothetical protein
VRVEQGGKLVGGGGASADVVFAEPGQALQFGEADVGGLKPAQAVAVGAQVVGEFVAVAGVGLGAGGTPAGTRGMKRGGMHRKDGMPGREEPVDDEAVRAFDDDR